MKQRQGYGKGLGCGYKNLLPNDSFIHGLSAKGVKQNDEGQLKILWKFPDDSKPKKPVPYTKREKTIGFGTLAGAGLGFVGGMWTFGTLGWFLGVPLGTLAGNIIARKSTKQQGRPSKIKFSLW